MNEIIEFLNVLIISVVAVLIFCVGWVIIYGASKRKFRELLSQRIKSLGKDDFSIINETKVGVVCVCTEENSKKYSNAIKVVGKRLNLTDHIQIRMEVPIHSVELYNYDYKAEEWNEKLWNDINVAQCKTC